MGNALEWYDWNVYALMAPFFAARFFVAGSQTSALLSSLAVFAVGFVARPVGGLVFGVISDRLGRRTAMLWSIGLMAAGSLLIGLTPAHGTIGIFAPLVLVLSRLAQGLSAGGEFGASAAYLVEAAPPHRKGLYSSFLYIGNVTGTLLAAGLGALLSNTLSTSSLSAWGWRVPFLIGGVAALVIAFLRRQMDETLPPADAAAPRSSLRTALVQFRRNRAAVFTVCGITASATVVYYTWIVALPATAADGGHLDKGDALLASTLAQVALLAALPFVGGLADRVGVRRLLLGFSGSFAVLCVPLYSLARASAGWLFVSELVGLLLFSGYGATAAAVMSSLFPTRARGTGIGLPYAATVAVFGGTAPFVSVWLADSGSSNTFAVYVSALCVLTFVVVLLRIGRSGNSAAEEAPTAGQPTGAAASKSLGAR
ncbi:MFS transporter [Streptomyces sp. A 4/2]|uniref:MFS transporter n=1 Tax=Streptomyces sp. A 4/2 TaxID=2934314 RepID=UPI002024E812|nr:MFS transporter [Streptomyces sp. A 4/2]